MSLPRKFTEGVTVASLLRTRREAAARLRVSERKVDDFIAAGELGTVRLGRKVFTTEALIQDLIERMTHQACRRPKPEAPSPSEAIGSARSAPHPAGTSSVQADAEYRSAQATFGKRRIG